MARDTYTEQIWENLPAETTPVNAERLSHIESGIKTAMDNRALKEIYSDQDIRLSYGNEEPTPQGKLSIEVGYQAKATENFSVAIGAVAEATGRNAASIGNGTKASHVEAFVIGFGTRSSRVGQFVCGRFNADGSDKVFIIGYGLDDASRENVHTVDYHGNAYFKGDVRNESYSLNEIGAQMGNISVDVTEECVVSVSGQTLEITVPLSLIMKEYGTYIVGGEFIGVINCGSIPPLMFNMQMSALKNGEVSGYAVLTNTIPSTIEAYGHKFTGSIELLFPGYSDPKAKATFSLGRDITAASAKIHRTAGSAIDFTISELRGGGMTYNETMEILNEVEEGTAE